MSETLLELTNVKKFFPVSRNILGLPTKYVKAVNNVSLSIHEGENVGLVGESGSGKTTLGRLILKLYSVTGGEINLCGHDITNLSPGAMRPLRKNVQMVFQDPYSSLDPRFRIYSILKEAMRLDAAQKDKDDERKLMSEMLEAVGLSGDVLMRYPHEFSGGERQRIAIARALIMNPRLLILDEAVSALDVLVQKQIIDLLKDIQEKYKLTYLFISHNLRVIRQLCAKIAVMYKGKIVELASADELFNNPLHPYTRELLSAAIHYKSIQSDFDFDEDENSQLVDQGNGHFVLK